MLSKHQAEVDYFSKLASEAGFVPVFGSEAGMLPPIEQVKSRMKSCQAFAGIVTVCGRGQAASAWIQNEIGMATALELPSMIACDSEIDDLGQMSAACSVLKFKPGRLSSEHAKLKKFLTDLKETVSKCCVEKLSEDGGFEARRARHWKQKQKIALHVVKKTRQTLGSYDDPEVFLDSGTTTFAFAQHLVLSTEIPIRIRTNSIPALDELSRVPAYPVFGVPGHGSEKYRALLGSETTNFIRKRLSNPDNGKCIRLAILAATSLNPFDGLRGNDTDHNLLKRLLLEECSQCFVIFEGEKLLFEHGSPIFTNQKRWLEFAKNARGRVEFVTHRPEAEHMTQIALKGRFDLGVLTLRKLFGNKAVTVLS